MDEVSRVDSEILPLSLERRVDAVCERFEAAWQTGRPPQIEEYLGAKSEPERSALLRELLSLEVEYRRRSGETPSWEEYRQRFPEHGDLLGAVLREDEGIAEPRSAEADSAAESVDTGPYLADAEKVQSGDHLGRYRIVAKVGSGGFGVVYKAFDEELRREVAIKVPHRRRVGRPEDVETFLAEARVLAGLDHPGIVPVYDAGRTEDGLCYLVSKLLAGSNLAERLRQSRSSAAAAAEITACLAEALGHAHQRGLVHRDIKPANILLDPEGNPILTDFGLALREEDFGQGPNFAGTPAYMSPEQARGEGHLVDGRTDVYSLGVVFYELLTGQRPFRADRQIDLFEQILTCEPRPARQLDGSIPKELDRIVLKALSKRATDRYSTALDLADDLRHWQAAANNHPIKLQVVVPPAAGGAPASRSTSQSASDSDSTPMRVVPKGLRSFDAEDAEFFLELLPGPRDRNGLPGSIRFWKTRIEATDPERTFRVGLVYGPSGGGKSSLVKAGLLPRLPSTILPVYLEATAADTEARLLKALRKCCPGVAESCGLVETLAALRRVRRDCLPPAIGQAAASPLVTTTGGKVLLVLDQFEQWLHAKREEESPELVQALRQCDGEHVLCLLLVRDDFGMAATRFMSDLEIPILQGRNFATFDLFDLRHARKVLTEFGRAFGCVPDDLGELTSNQEQFLDMAVAGLAQDGKVIPVRLALFAEMVKGRPWTPATLKDVGGIEGFGVTFLEETFTGRAANPEHRLHQKAARAVLKALLPEQGTDIKGHQRSHQQLLEASEYGRRPQAFGDLLRILDTELRLITPTDPESRPPEFGDQEAFVSPPAPQPVNAGRSPEPSQHYQLTHDYLVPALQQWLTRKQRETVGGRAEVRLAERSALWNAKPQNRQLPAWWEWVNILLFTRRRNWTTPQRRMMRAANRQRLLHAGVVAVVLALLGGGLSQISAYLTAAAHVRSLGSAGITEVPTIVKELSSYRRWAEPLLAKMFKKARRDSKQRLNASLALLAWDAGQVDYLYERMLKATGPDEFWVICKALEEYYYPRELVPRLWAFLDQETDRKKRLRAACALARYDLANPRWAKLSDQVADMLLTEDQALYKSWLIEMMPARFQLANSLRKILVDSTRPEWDRLAAATLSLRCLPGETESKILADATLDADDHFSEAFLQFLLCDPDATGLMNEELNKPQSRDASEEARNAAAKRQARAAVVLLQLDQQDRIWPLRKAERIWSLFRQGSDPRVRTYLIHRIGRTRADPETLIRQYMLEEDRAGRRALLLSLGEFEDAKLPASKRQPLIPGLLQTYREDPDPGIHSAIDWLLRLPQWDSGKHLHQIDHDLAGLPPGSRGWYVTNRQDHTLAIVKDPGEFQMGSPGQEAHRRPEEALHRRRIPRSFAIGTKEVTVKQFKEFLLANPNIRHDWASAETYSPGADGPMISVTWFEAAQYCRWLSEKAGIPPEQMCYPPLDEIREGMRLPADYLSRTGYRLPTEAEWEYACRAGAVTSRHSGVADGMLRYYAWYMDNSNGRAWPVGSKKPNDYGLFDMYGNAWEWCQDAASPYPAGLGGQPIEDKECLPAIITAEPRVLRGGAFFSAAPEIRSAHRFAFQPNVPFVPAGLRVAKTWP